MKTTTRELLAAARCVCRRIPKQHHIRKSWAAAIAGHSGV